MTNIKICGLRRIEDINYVNELLPEYVGFVFAKKSKRYVTPEQAAELSAALDSRICPVGVFVNETIENITALVKKGVIRIAQLHGSESDDFAAELKNNGIDVIRAFRIQSAEDMDKAVSSPADMILLDSGMGSGVTFDHSLIRNVSRPYFLAGGLDPKNVKQAIEALHPFAVDVSSGIETNGVKDCNKMMEFAYAVRNNQKAESRK